MSPSQDAAMPRSVEAAGDQAINRTGSLQSWYRDAPLLEPGQIRLLRLMPHEREDAGIECQLVNYQLRDSSEGANLYEALSYVWGDKSTRRSISINKCDVQVTANLHAALLHLRDRFFERVLWVDAICINQQDADEKGCQVNSMANIYAKAGRVLVWLGEAAEDSNQAIEDIRAAASQERYKADKTRQDSIFSLLQRTWFDRVWVLQEVAAARQVLIKCGSAEMDGYAFCSGLGALKLPYESCPGLQSIVYTATYLIRGALFRPRRGPSQSGPSQSGPFSLKIRPLSELVEMYHTRQATEHHDKVYALLGMASDNADKKLLADYNISWEQLFTQLIHNFLPEQHSVATWSGREVAIIRGKGYLLGEVSSVAKDSTWEDRQIVHITWRHEWNGAKHEKTSTWPIQSGAKAIRNGDLVCLLQGAAKPTILRLLDDHIAIIRIAVHLDGEEFDENGTWLETSLLDLPLVWDWENDPKAGGYDKLFVSSQVPKPSDLDEHLEKIARLESMRLAFQSTRRYDALAENLRTTIEVFERAFETVDKAAVPVSKILATVDQFIRCNGAWETICIAATEGHKSVIRLLLDAGMVDLDSEKHLRAPLWLATHHKHEEVSKLLLSAGGANWNMEGTDGQTALFQAAENGNGMVVKLLLDSGKVDQDAENMDGCRPLGLAAESGNEVAIYWLLKKGASLESTDKDGNTPLGQAAQQGHIAVVELLLEKRANLESTNNQGNTPLGLAAWQGHKAVVELLLRNGTNLESTDNQGNTPLARAAWQGHNVVMELLLQMGANLESIDKNDNTPLGQAAWQGHKAAVELLLQNGANLESTNYQDDTPLGRAARQGHKAVVELLLQKGANLESTDKDGYTLLGRAAWQGHKAAVELLLQKGANLESTDFFGNTPLGQAAWQGHNAVVELLLQKGANLESTNVFGNTSLGQAAWQGHNVVVELLLQKGANLESTNKHGNTPLGLAAWQGDEAVVEILLQKGANLESTNKRGQTPRMIAAQQGHKSVVEVLWNARVS